MKRISVILPYLFYASLAVSACSVHTFQPTEGDRTSQEANPAIVQVGKRNFWEVNAAMATVAGMSPEDHLAVIAGTSRSAGASGASAGTSRSAGEIEKIKKAWDEVSTMMARKNNLDGCDPGTQVAVFRLATAHCQSLIFDETAWGKFAEQNFGDEEIDISKLSKSAVAAVMLDSLQTGSRLSQQQREKSLATIVNYLDDTVTGDSVSKEALFDVCTMVLGSAATMLN